MTFERSTELIRDAEDWNETINEEIEYHETGLKKENKSQAKYTSLAGWYSSLGIVYFLHGDPLEEVKATFTKSAECIEMSFIMAYDKDSPDFMGDRASLARVSMTYAIDGMNVALMAGDFETAARIAKWTQIPASQLPEAADPTNGDILVTNYSHALKYMLLDDKEQAMDYCFRTQNFFKKYKMTEGYRENFGHRTNIVKRILERDRAGFHSTFRHLFEFHLKRCKPNGDLYGTPEAEIYIDGVALYNLAIKNGLRPIKTTKGKIPRLVPEELLIN